MPECKRDVVFGTEVSQSVPAEYALDTNDNVLQIRKNDFKKWFGIGFDILMNHDFSFAADNADIHFSGMQVDATVIFMLIVVEFHFASFADKG